MLYQTISRCYGSKKILSIFYAFPKPNLLNQTFQTKTAKPNLPSQTYLAKPTEPNLPNQTYGTKPIKPNLPNQNKCINMCYDLKAVTFVKTLNPYV